SLLSRPVRLRGIRTIDVTKEKDFTNEQTINNIIRNLRGPGDVFFYCSPCTGGSAWQNLNVELAKRIGWKHTMVRLVYHWDLHWRLWNSFERVAKHCHDVGATVLLEWPIFCTFWTEEKVSNFLRSLQFRFTVFDGCMYGIVSERGGHGRGVPIRKNIGGLPI
ncbi:MAG: hypothetical protein ACKPKO_06055, partial [Candidatus Fonsibacter sp.]